MAALSLFFAKTRKGFGVGLTPYCSEVWRHILQPSPHFPMTPLPERRLLHSLGDW